MIQAICTEIQNRKNELANETIETIYFGGGTPSILEKEEIASILTHIQTHYTLATSLEITLEANPDDISENSVSAWFNLGINRLSIGLQSFHDESLQWMNRAHTVAQSLQCIPIAQQNGISNISIDLIYGLPNISNEVWEKDLQKAIELGVQHISAYCLTIEEKTVLAKWVKNNKIIPASNDEQNKQFQSLQEKLKQTGFMHYEISNFALPGFISKHNSNYWKGKKYIGIGPSAHSYSITDRSWNIANNTKYIQGIENNTPNFERETLSNKDQFNEAILIGLRTMWGVNLEKLNEILRLSDEFTNKMQEFIDKKWMYQIENHLVLTEEGKSWADKIASDLFVS
jgi:oxygen-independent coproporphyrinogen-3 oxidase